MSGDYVDCLSADLVGYDYQLIIKIDMQILGIYLLYFVAVVSLVMH
jgi:hypothetical protein